MIIRIPPKLTNRNSVIKYIEIDLWSWLKELGTAILKIDFRQNFQCFIVENITLPGGGEEVAISNGFRVVYPGVIPSSRIVTRQNGGGIILDGDTKWNANQVFLKNTSIDDAIITVIFFK